MKETNAGLLLVLTTFPDADRAREIAGRLIDERLAACVTLLAPAESHYDWNGSRQSAAEVPAFIKTTAQGYDRLEARLHELHPYEVPEIVALPASAALAPYAEWIRTSCGNSNTP